MVVVGQRNHTNTIPAPYARNVEDIRVRSVCTQAGYGQPDLVCIEFVNRFLRGIENHRVNALLIQPTHQPLAGITEAADQVKRLLNSAHPAGKGIAFHQANKTVVLEQRENLANAVQPPDHRGVYHNHRPRSLAGGKGVGNFPKANGGTHEADKIEGVEKIHTPGITLVIYTGNQHEAEHRNGVDDDDRDDRCTQAS